MAVEYNPNSDHYTALGIDATATHDDIKKAHRALIRKLHPDLGGAAMPAAQVNIARDILLDPITRREYDQARLDWHERNPLASMFTEAGRRLYRERAPAQSPAAEPAQRAASAQPPPAEWRSRVAKSYALDKLALAIVSGQWLDAAAILGSAYILDRVIDYRVGDDPEKRASLDALAKGIQFQHAKEFVDALATELGSRLDSAGGNGRSQPRRVVRKKTRTVVRSGGSGKTGAPERLDTRGRGAQPARHGSPGRADRR